jgi:hypothetical protein
MRRVFVSVVASVLLAIVMHVMPAAYDSFVVVELQGRSIKVFPRGWPVSYVFEGEMRDHLWLVALKLLVNVTLTSLTMLLIVFVWNYLRKGNVGERSERGK